MQEIGKRRMEEQEIRRREFFAEQARRREVEANKRKNKNIDFFRRIFDVKHHMSVLISPLPPAVKYSLTKQFSFFTSIFTMFLGTITPFEDELCHPFLCTITMMSLIDESVD